MKTYKSMILGGTQRNAERLGAFVAWLVSNQLFTPHVEKSAGSTATRVRMHDLTGADFLAMELHGELKPEQLTEPGQSFTEHYLMSGQFDADYDSVDFNGENEWIRYEALAPKMTKAYQAFVKPAKTGLLQATAKILKFPGAK